MTLSPTSQQAKRKRSEVKSFRSGSGIWDAVLLSILGTCKRNLNICNSQNTLFFTKKNFF